ncbi:MAG: hypothetical protein EBT04_16150, partial [Betaproteobacteria bacterium]|nr:hypothetical protein [Betaproteobacteria bacterium]
TACGALQLGRALPERAARGPKARGQARAAMPAAEGYQTLRNGPWGGYSGYDRFFAKPPNNAQLAAVGTYDELVPGFLAMLRDADPAGTRPLVPFFDRVRVLAKESRATRRATLANLGNLATVAMDARLNPGKPLFDPSSFCDVRTL